MERKGNDEKDRNFGLIGAKSFSKNVFESFLSNEPVTIQQIGKLIRLRLEAADKRLDGYTLEIK